MHPIFRIFHISDIHYGKSDEINNRTRNLLKSLNERSKKYEEKSVLLITGDLVDDGCEKQFKELKKIIDEEVTNFGDDSIFFVPGNHDYGKTGNLIALKNIVPYFKIFHGKEESYYYDRNKNEGKKLFFPHIHTKEAYQKGKAIPFTIQFVAIDSLQGQFKDLDRLWADGEVGNIQMNNIKARMKEETSGDYKIAYLHHHPTDKNFFTRLDDRKSFSELMQELKMDLVLCGHDHPALDETEKRVFKIPEKGKRLDCFCATSSTDVGDKCKGLNTNLVTIYANDQLELSHKTEFINLSELPIKKKSTKGCCCLLM